MFIKNTARSMRPFGYVVPEEKVAFNAPSDRTAADSTHPPIRPHTGRGGNEDLGRGGERPSAEGERGTSPPLGIGFLAAKKKEERKSTLDSAT